MTRRRITLVSMTTMMTTTGTSAGAAGDAAAVAAAAAAAGRTTTTTSEMCFRIVAATVGEGEEAEAEAEAATITGGEVKTGETKEIAALAPTIVSPCTLSPSETPRLLRPEAVAALPRREVGPSPAPLLLLPRLGRGSKRRIARRRL